MVSRLCLSDIGGDIDIVVCGRVHDNDRSGDGVSGLAAFEWIPESPGMDD